MKFTFTNKETYLAYRSEWKAQYKKLSADIRAVKHTWKHHSLRRKATAMLEELKLARVEAQRLYQAERATLQPVAA